MLPIERDRIAVMAAGRVVSFAETNCIVSKCYEPPLHQVQSSLQLWIAGKSGRFFFPGLRRLMRTKNYRSFGSYIFWNEQIRRHEFTRLSLKNEFPQDVAGA